MKNKKLIRPYVLGDEKEIKLKNFPSFDQIHQRLAQDGKVSLSQNYRISMDLSYIGQEIIKYGEWINALSVPCCVALFQIDHSPHMFMVEFNQQIIDGLVDHHLGAMKKESRANDRSPSQIDLSIAKPFLDQLIILLEKSWSYFHVFHSVLQRWEISPQLLGITYPADILLKASFQLETKFISSEFCLIYTYKMLKEFLK